MPAALPRQSLADVDPQVAVLGVLPGHGVVGDGDARHFDDTALDGVDQGEVGHHPREQRAFRAAGIFAARSGRGRQVEDRLDADLLVNGLQPGDPQAGVLVAGAGFLLLLAGQLLGHSRRLRPVAVVRLVVDDEDFLLRAEFPANATDHLARRFGERPGVPGGEDALGEPSCVPLLPPLEGVEVDDDDFRRTEFGDRLARHDV